MPTTNPAKRAPRSASPKTVRLDTRGRVALADAIKQLGLSGLSGFNVSFDPDHPARLILDAVVEVPAAAALEHASLVELSVRDAQRLIEILDDESPPGPHLKAAAARFAAWESNG